MLICFDDKPFYFDAWDHIPAIQAQYERLDLEEQEELSEDGVSEAYMIRTLANAFDNGEFRSCDVIVFDPSRKIFYVKDFSEEVEEQVKNWQEGREHIASWRYL